MMKLLKKFTTEKFGIFSFLLFLVLTPVILKIKITEGVYVEPLLPLLLLGSFLLFVFKYRETKSIWKAVRKIIFPNRLAVIYFSLMGVLLISFIYGYFLTGIFSSGTFLRLIKYTLYFLPFPLAIYAGRYLGRTNTNRVLVLIVLIGVATALVSLIRIFTFIKSGGVIDFWEYGIYNRSVGVLGQFFDPLSLATGLTGKAAHGTYGLYATIILVVCLVITSRFKEFSTRWLTFFFMGTFIFYASILYTLSRGAILTAGLVFSGWFVWLLKEKKVKTVIFTLLFLVFSSVLLIWLNPQVYDKFASTLEFLPTRGVATADPSAKDKVWGDEWDIALDASSRGRLERWGQIVDTLKSNPQFALFGVGYSQENLEKFTGVSLTHSLFLDLWARGGILAFLLLIGVWVLIFSTIIRFLFSQDPEVRTFGYLLGAFATGWLLDNIISGEQFFSDAPMILFWGVLGLVQALAEIYRESGKRKVLLALTSAEVAGAPQVVVDLLQGVKRNPQFKKELELVVVAPRGPFLKKFKDLGYRVYQVELDRISFKSFREFSRIAKKEEISLINSQGKGAGLYARKTGFLLGIPVVQTFHGLHYHYRNPLARFFYLWLERLLTLFTKLVINVSDGQEREGIKLKLFPKGKSRVVLNGIDFKMFRGSREKFRKDLALKPTDLTVAMVARFDPVKGHLRLIRLLPKILSEVPNLKVLFVGPFSPTLWGKKGDIGKEAKQLVGDLGIRERVSFLGEREDVPKILAASDVFVLPSYHEGLPVSVLEASASGLPVIGSNVVGIKDTIQDGKTGFLVDFNKSQEVVQAFKKLAKSPALRKKIGERGRKFVTEKFAMDKFVKGTLRVYSEALSD